jgi:DNA-binding NarL/FixJ family response regulator
VWTSPVRCAASTILSRAPERDDGVVNELRTADVRVLVVDDQELFRRAMATVVDETEGFVVVGVAASGEESIRQAERLRPQLVLMDVNLPGIDGIEATRRILGRLDGTVVVLLSTYDEDEFDQAMCGASSYVPKGLFGPGRLQQAWASATSTR